MTKFTAIALVFASIIATGCGQATTLTKVDHAGSIALEGSYMGAMGDARLMMAEHCQGRFDVIELDHAVAYQCRNSGETHNLVAAR